MEPSDLNISQDPVVYPPQEVKSLLHRNAEGNRATCGCIFINKVYGITGCIKFLESYYLILVTKRKQIGFICGHAIYSIQVTQILTTPHVSVKRRLAHSKTELSLTRNKLDGSLMRERVKRIKKERKSVVWMRGANSSFGNCVVIRISVIKARCRNGSLG
ncbi:putative SAC domain, polyphosphoinositide phosphatase Fig4 [Helianthus debilis subsp. tardiflorus]